MTTAMPLSSQPKETMPTKESQWGKLVTPGMLAVMMGGGVPYISALESKLADARESTIRLEVKVETLSDDVKSMKATIEAIRQRLEARGIVNHLDSVSADTANQSYKHAK